MKMSKVLLIALLVAYAAAASPKGANNTFLVAPDGSTFRFDYVFQQGLAGWLKLHRTSASWHNARLMCNLEGAVLASPLNSDFSSIMMWTLQSSNVQSVFTGLHSRSFSTDFFSVEGIHMQQVPLDWELQSSSVTENERCLGMNSDGRISQVSCDEERPFFCYKPYEAPIEMNACGTTDAGYTVNSYTGSCYKFYTKTANWDHAHIRCAADGGRLAVINSAIEMVILSELSRGYTEFVHVGGFNWYRDDGFDDSKWMTVDGKTLAEAGFEVWGPYQPDNVAGNEYCLSIGWDNNAVGFYDVPCSAAQTFICEIETIRIPVWW